MRTPLTNPHLHAAFQPVQRVTLCCACCAVRAVHAVRAVRAVRALKGMLWMPQCAGMRAVRYGSQ